MAPPFPPTPSSPASSSTVNLLAIILLPIAGAFIIVGGIWTFLLRRRRLLQLQTRLSNVPRGVVPQYGWSLRDTRRSVEAPGYGQQAGELFVGRGRIRGAEGRPAVVRQQEGGEVPPEYEAAGKDVLLPGRETRVEPEEPPTHDVGCEPPAYEAAVAASSDMVQPELPQVGQS